MPEEALETHELKEQLEESAEHAEHAKHGPGKPGGHGEHHESKTGWVLYLSLSTAIIAVFAAIASLRSGHTESEAMLSKNDAIMKENEVTDAWAHYQAKSLKKALYDTQAEATQSPELQKKFKDKAAGYETDTVEIGKDADKLTEERKTLEKESERFLDLHHFFAYAVTIFQVAIALSAISALTKWKPMWLLSMVVAAFGLYFFVQGFGLFHG